MTWASTQLGSQISSRVSRTGTYLKKRMWLWPIIAVVLLSVIGFMTRRAIESTIKGNLASSLETLLTVEVGMLENWFAGQQAIAESLANDITAGHSIYE